MTDDLISRNALMDALHDHFLDGFEEDRWWNSTHVLAAIEGLPSAQSNGHLCRNCKYVKYYGNVDKHGDVQSYWYCMNWDGGTDEEGFCHKWEERKENG